MLFVLPIIGPMLALGGLDENRIAEWFGARTPVRASSAYMAFTGAGLAVAGLVQWTQWVFAGVEPSIGDGGATRAGRAPDGIARPWPPPIAYPVREVSRGEERPP